METSHWPTIIQGGMGAAVSSWRLAKAVSQTGQLGVVSGVALDTVLARRLQLGDPDGHLRRAMEAFPFPGMVEHILDRYFIPGGKPPQSAFASPPLLNDAPTRRQLELIVVANFVEVYLAKEDHDGAVGINYLEKIQLPFLPSVFGAMLAGVDYVLMGAGIPRFIPGALDQLSNSESVELPLTVEGATAGDNFSTRFDPTEFAGADLPWMERPRFLAIVASSSLAAMLAKKANGRVDGFVVEGPTAGGHNAPPRGKLQLNERGEPVYGERDVADFEQLRALQRPFWLAGSYGSAEQVAKAFAFGAAGVQVGTAFAFCDESGLAGNMKKRVLEIARCGKVDVVTDPLASPAGFPFKVLQLQGTLSEASLYERRRRGCELGFLRQGYRKCDGTVGWRCPAEDIGSYLRKGGKQEDTAGRKCLCNGLLANVGLAQIRRGEPERPLVTCGDDVQNIRRFLKDESATSYSAKDVVEHLLCAVATSESRAI